MYTIEVEILDRLRQEIDELVREGFFKNPGEIMRIAALDFVPRSKLEMIEQQQREDIAWALEVPSS